MYELTKHQKVMNSIELSKNIRVNNKKLTDRTIRRWFNLLKRDRNFNYFPSARQDSIGLVSTYVLTYNIKNEDIYKIIPYHVYSQDGFCFRNLKNMYLIHYYLPPNSNKKFKKFWNHAKKNKLVEDFIICKCKPSTAIYQPFHKVLNSKGVFKINDTSESGIIPHLKVLDKTNNRAVSKTPHKILYSFPLIVPILCEHFGEHFSSHNIWFNLKKKLGEKVWNYIPSMRAKRKRKDGVGIKQIQMAIKQIFKNSEEIIQQIRVSYTPIYTNNLGLHLLTALKHDKKIIEFTKKLSKYSIQVVATPPNNSKGLGVYYIITDHKGFFNILTKVLTCYIDQTKQYHILMQHNKKIKDTYSKINYAETFDPKTCEWKYNHKKYMKELEKLSKSTKLKRRR